MLFRVFLSLVVFFLFLDSTWSRESFELVLDVEGQVGAAKFDEIEDFVKSLSNAGMKGVVNSYTETSQTTAILDIRGLTASASYESNSTTLVFTVPYLNMIVSFQGATRDESNRLFYDWLKGKGGDLLTSLLQALIEKSPIDPVAGNPNSLMAKMVASDFTMGAKFGTSGLTPLSEEKEKDNLTMFGARFGQYAADDFDTDAYTLPLGYIFTLDNNTLKEIIIDAPLTYVDNNGSKAYNGSLGLGLTLEALNTIETDENDTGRNGRKWLITPAIRGGLVGSRDLGSAAHVFSGSVTSNYNIYLGEYTVSIGNMFGVYKTGDIEIGDYKTDYNVVNYVVRNGIELESMFIFDIYDNPISWKFSIVGTQFFGDDLFVEHYGDIALSAGIRHEDESSIWNALRIGVTATVGERDYIGYGVNFGYSF